MEYTTLYCPELDANIRSITIDGCKYLLLSDVAATLGTKYNPTQIRKTFVDQHDVVYAAMPESRKRPSIWVTIDAVYKFSHLGHFGTILCSWLRQVSSKDRAKVIQLRPQEVMPAVAPKQPTAVTPFVFPVTGQSVRAVMVEGNPMFVASEVAEILGYAKPRNAILQHCKHAKLFKSPESGRLTDSPYGINLIPESDVYRLIMRSKLPAAEQFEAWVTETVLPAIRKDGGYILGEEKVVSGELEETQFLLQAFTMLQNKANRLAEEKIQLESENAALVLENEQMTPKAEMYDKFMDSTGLISITNGGKIFGMSGVAMGRFLRDIDWLFKRTDEVIPKQHVLDAGLMDVVTGASETGRPFVSGKLTPEGIEELYRKYGLRKKAI